MITAGQWVDRYERFARTWRDEFGAAQARVAASISANAEAYRERVGMFLGNITLARGNLAICQDLLKRQPKSVDDAARTARIGQQLHMAEALAEGIKVNSTDMAKREVGIAPAVVLVVGFIGLSIAGVAWAVWGYEEAKALRDRTQLERDELIARDAASREGRTLPDSTLPPGPAEKKGDSSGAGAIVLAVGALAAAGGALWWFTRGSR